MSKNQDKSKEEESGIQLEPDGIRVEHKLKRPSNNNAKDKGRNKRLQAKHISLIAQNIGKKSKGEIMREAGYSESYSKTPSFTKKTQTFQELMNKHLSDGELIITHKSLKDSRRLEHMVFPTMIEDEDIDELLRDANCILRKIVHSEQAKHAYFWSPDNKARKDALDMAYKLKGHYAPNKIIDATDQYRNLSTEELMKKKKELIKFYKKED